MWVLRTLNREEPVKAKLIFHRKVDSIAAHFALVMAAMAVGHGLEQVSGCRSSVWCIHCAKYQTFTLEVAGQIVHAATPVPADVRQILEKIGVDVDR